MPPAEPAFDGVIGRTYQESTPSWPQPVAAARRRAEHRLHPARRRRVRAPRLLRLEHRDAEHGPAGGRRPALHELPHHRDVLARPAPALLTGRNHHAAGLGHRHRVRHRLPGYDGRLTKRAATLAEMLRPHGYNTLRRRQVAPDAAPRGHRRRRRSTPGRSSAASTAGTASRRLHRSVVPGAVRRQPVIDPPRRTRATTCPRTWSTTPSSTSRDQQRVAPDKPFFLYVAFGAATGRTRRRPLHRQVSRQVRHRAGTSLRGEWLARQKALGIVPAGTRASAAQPDDVPAWDALTTDEQRLCGPPDGGLRRLHGPHRRPDRAAGRVPGGDRPARQHADRADLGQRRQQRGGAVGCVQRLQALQPRSESRWSEPGRPRPPRRRDDQRRTTRPAGPRPATRRSSGTRRTSTAAASAIR